MKIVRLIAVAAMMVGCAAPVHAMEREINLDIIFNGLNIEQSHDWQSFSASTDILLLQLTRAKAYIDCASTIELTTSKMPSGTPLRSALSTLKSAKINSYAAIENDIRLLSSGNVISNIWRDIFEVCETIEAKAQKQSQSIQEFWTDLLTHNGVTISNSSITKPTPGSTHNGSNSFSGTDNSRNSLLGDTPSPQPQPASNQKASAINKPTRELFINNDGSLKAQEYIEAWNAYKEDGNNVTGDKELAVKFRTKQMLHALAEEVGIDALWLTDTIRQDQRVILRDAIRYFQNWDDFEQAKEAVFSNYSGIVTIVGWEVLLNNAPRIHFPNFQNYKKSDGSYDNAAFVSDLYSKINQATSQVGFDWNTASFRDTKTDIMDSFLQPLISNKNMAIEEPFKKVFDSIVSYFGFTTSNTNLETVSKNLGEFFNTVKQENFIALLGSSNSSGSNPDSSSSDNTQKSLIFGLSTKKAVFVALGLATAAAVAGGIYYAMSTGKDSDAQLEENG